MPRTARPPLGQIRDFGFAAIFVAATSSLSNPAVGQSQAPTLDRPPDPTVGETFTLKWDGQTVVRTYIGQKNGLNCYSDKAADGRQSEECFTSDDNLVSRVGTWKPGEFTPYFGRLSFPLFVGKQWVSSYTLSNAALHSYMHEATQGRFILIGDPPGVDERSIIARVVSYEKVTVPAGTFDAFKILATQNRWGGRHGDDIIEYYSPQLGMIKDDEVGIYGGSEQFETHFELISFSLAKPGA
jgi:hypothetical protein